MFLLYRSCFVQVPAFLPHQRENIVGPVLLVFPPSFRPSRVSLLIFHLVDRKKTLGIISSLLHSVSPVFHLSRCRQKEKCDSISSLLPCAPYPHLSLSPTLSTEDFVALFLPSFLLSPVSTSFFFLLSLVYFFSCIFLFHVIGKSLSDSWL